MVTSDKRFHTHASHLKVLYGTDVLLLPSPSPDRRHVALTPPLSLSLSSPPGSSSQLFQFLYSEGKGETAPLTIYKFPLRVDIAKNIRKNSCMNLSFISSL